MDTTVIVTLSILGAIVIALIFFLIVLSYEPRKHDRSLLDDNIAKPNLGKGEQGELLVDKELRNIAYQFGGYVYRQLGLEDKYSNRSEIDNIYISDSGVFIIETKNRSGKIIGFENDEKWIIKHKHSHKYIENPLRQNQRHVRFFSRVFPHCCPIHSLVIFIDADISDVNISNVINLYQLGEYIKRIGRQISDSKMEYINSLVKKVADNPPFTHKQYSKWVKDHFRDGSFTN